ALVQKETEDDQIFSLRHDTEQRFGPDVRFSSTGVRSAMAWADGGQLRLYCIGGWQASCPGKPGGFAWAACLPSTYTVETELASVSSLSLTSHWRAQTRVQKLCSVSCFGLRAALFYAYFENAGVADLFFFEHIAHNHGPVLNRSILGSPAGDGEPVPQAGTSLIAWWDGRTEGGQGNAEFVLFAEVE